MIIKTAVQWRKSWKIHGLFLIIKKSDLSAYWSCSILSSALLILFRLPYYYGSYNFIFNPAIANSCLFYRVGWPAGNPCGSSLFTLFFFALKNIAGFYIDKAHYKFNSRVAIRISHNKLVNYQNAGYDEFINIDSSKHLRMICMQPFEFCQYILTGIQQMITQVCLIIIAVLAILLFNAKLFLLL